MWLQFRDNQMQLIIFTLKDDNHYFVSACVCVCVIKLNPILWGQNVPTKMAISEIIVFFWVQWEKLFFVRVGLEVGLV